MTGEELDEKILTMVATSKRPTVGGINSRLRKCEPLIDMEEYVQRKFIEASWGRLIGDGKLCKSGLRVWLKT